MLDLPKNGDLANGHDTMTETDLGKVQRRHLVDFPSLLCAQFIVRERCSKSVAKRSKVNYQRGCVV